MQNDDLKDVCSQHRRNVINRSHERFRCPGRGDDLSPPDETPERRHHDSDRDLLPRLDGRRAATHWGVAARLQALHPAVAVDPDAIYVRDGHLWTSAGVTAGIDLALALVEEDYGHALALEVARDMVMYLKRPGGQSQFSVQLASQATAHRGMQDVQAWALEHLSEPLTLQVLADRAAMSERHFRRVFVQETGRTPSAFIESARLEAARRLLESDAALPLKTVAARVGLGSEQALRHLFLRHLGIPPQAYRERFGD